MSYKSHDPARQATSDRFQRGLRDGLADQQRQNADPPRELAGMDPEFAESWMYKTGYEVGLAEPFDN